MTLVLASASASRARLLEAADVSFEVCPARIDEEEVRRSLLHEGRDAGAVADVLAELKALRISASRPGDLVIGADQVLSFEGEIIGKCSDLGEAEALLRRLRGKAHLLIGGLVLARNGALIWRHQSRARLTMRAFSDNFLASYLAREGETLFETVGCYRLEAGGAQLFDRIDGDYFAILGLDLLPLLAQLRELGVIDP